VAWQTCKRCQHRVNAAAQKAYYRGRAQFESIVSDDDIEVPESPPRPKFGPQPMLPPIPEVTPKTRQTYQQAYAALQIALEHTLPDEQRFHSIEMLSKISKIFARSTMIAPRESYFWANLLLEALQRREYWEIEDALNDLEASAFSLSSLFERFNLRWRRYRLTRSLRNLSKELDWFEQMGFQRPPRVHHSDDEWS